MLRTRRLTQRTTDSQFPNRSSRFLLHHSTRTFCGCGAEAAAFRSGFPRKEKGYPQFIGISHFSLEFSSCGRTLLIVSKAHCKELPIVNFWLDSTVILLKLGKSKLKKNRGHIVSPDCPLAAKLEPGRQYVNCWKHKIGRPATILFLSNDLKVGVYSKRWRES